MTEWKIIIRTNNEQQAIEYINMMVQAFRAAVTIKQPMDFYKLENPDTKEKLTCNLVKK